VYGTRVRDPLAGTELTPGAGVPLTAWPISLLFAWASVVCLYWAGMILNDVFDVRSDRRARPDRPLARRAIGLSTARWAGWGLLAAGVVLSAWFSLAATVTEFGPAATVAALPTGVAILLAVCIVAYDGPGKRTVSAPLWMGACRMLSFLLGATAGLASIPPAYEVASALGAPVVSGIPLVVFALALGMGVYITGITWFARQEASGGTRLGLSAGWILMLVGSALLAFSPWLGSVNAAVWKIDVRWVYPFAVAIMLAPTLVNGRRALAAPSPAAVQGTVRSALLAIIPIAAAIAMIGVGASAALPIFALLIPSQWLSRRFAMT